ncbi:MAG: pantetheine-phosphate adenylyltransferase [Vampirovibrio sp.]|nr:pantetheine-phosphate adenylyltransferase [Vampirovibrio sp.]
MTTAVYPGSFDPITLGHIDIVNRASRLFEKVIVAIVKNPNKKSFIPFEDRMDLVSECTRHLENVEVEVFEGLTVDFAKSHRAKVLIRGLRAVSDFEYEFKMSQMNKNLSPDIETIFMMAGTDYQFLSSSMVKEVAMLGGDVSKIVPKVVHERLVKMRESTCCT